jgi:hypothetical protein
LWLSTAIVAHAQCSTPANVIVAENCLPGNPVSDWQITGSGDPTIQGFATDISVNVGQTIYFKIDIPATAYTIDIYRLGYYQGNGARKVASVSPSARLPQTQPACMSDAATFLLDCGNWAVSASWSVPANATSGYYFAHLIRTDTGGDSHIFFIVRNDASHSDILFQASDETWTAYNNYGGHSLYGTSEFDLTNRGYKVSYNRPSNTRDFENETFLFNGEYPMIRWIEANGFDVSYFTGVDAARNGSLIRNHKAYLSVGHDEYWSGPHRANVEAARDAGVNLAFFSGNEVFWKTRWENSIDGANTPYRTLVCYKETLAGTPIEPSDPPTWTGTWRDPRFSPPADGGRPENSLTGTLFEVNGPGTDNTDLAIQVPQADGQMRFWRNTSIASLGSGPPASLPPGSLGYEWDVDADNGFRPAGTWDLSTVAYTLTTDLLLDYGATYGGGPATHHMTMHRAPSGALVFGAGTVQWAWGLDSNHDGDINPAADIRMQQATVNLFADMGVQAGSLQSGLVQTSKSTDTVPPISTILSPSSNANIVVGPLTITGTATDTGGGVVGGVEVSVDGGNTWHPATGRSSWSYPWSPPTLGPTTILSRAVDDSGNLETPGPGIPVNLVAPDCQCSAFGSSTTPAVIDSGDASAVELGVKFKADYAGYITGIRFYKSSANTGTHVGNLWSAGGALLATATFSGETSSGWQQVNFSPPVSITANTVYVASYFAPSGHYSATSSYFALSGLDSPPVHLLANGVSGPNGLYAYSSRSAYPATGSPGTNYWVDVVFVPAGPMAGSPPALITSAPSVKIVGYTGGAVTTQSVSLYNEGTGTLAWTATASAPWVTLSSSSGTAPSTLTISANIGGLATGTYSGTVTVSSPGSNIPPQTISVTLTVTNLLMQSSFATTGLQGWVFSPLGLANDWSIVSGALQNNGGGHTQIFAGDGSWTDYDFQASILLSSLKDYTGGIRGRVNPVTGASYAVWLYPNEGLIKLFRASNWNIDAGVVQLGQVSMTLDASQYHTLKLSFRGSQIQVSYDSTLLLTVTDSAYSSGLIALDVSSQPVTFNNLFVTSPVIQATAQLVPQASALAFTTSLPGANPPSQTVQLNGSGTSVLAFTTVSTASWLTVTPVNGTTGLTLTASVNISGLTPGTYTGSIQATSLGATTPVTTINVSLTINAVPPAIATSASSLGFTAVSGLPAPATQNLTVTNSGYGAFSYTATTDSSWLLVTPGTGSTPGSVSVSVNASSLAVGTYSGNVIISASGVANSPVSIPVTLTVNALDMKESFGDFASGWIISPMGQATGWTSSGGAYSYSGGGLSQSCAGNTAWTDYTFDANVRLSNLSNWTGGVRGRVNPATGAGYSTRLYPGSGLIILYSTPQWNINGPGVVALAQQNLTFDSATHDLRMIFQGNRISVLWDGVSVISATDSSYSSGYVCLDGDSQPITYSNIEVSSQLAPAILSASPATLTFASSPGTPPTAQTVTVTAGGASTTWAVTSSASWLSAPASSSLTPGSITVTVNANGLAEGNYSGTLTISAPGATGSPLVIPVTLAVKTAALAAAPGAMTFFGATTMSPPSQNLSVTNIGTGSLAWNGAAGSTWLGLSSASGNAPASIQVTTNTVGLAPGTYSDAITITSPDAANSPVSVPITLENGLLNFYDNFSAGAGNWTISPLGYAADWSTANNQYTFNGAGHTQSWAGNSAWTNYSVSADFTLSSLHDYPGGIRGRLNTSTGAGYGVWLYPAEGVLKLFNIGQWNIDSQLTLLGVSGHLTFDTNPHNLRLVFQGSSIQVYYDNVLQIQVNDSTLTQGAIALDVSNQPISFTNVTVIGF